jgi:hypothetical protein
MRNKKLTVKIDEIKNSSLFVGVPPKFLKNVPKYCEVKELSQGSTIIKEGETGDFMFIILQGEVDILKGPKQDKVATLSQGAFVGEGALVSGAPRNATVVCKTTVKVAYFDKQGFDGLVVVHPAIPVTLMKTHTERCKSVVKTNGSALGKSKKVIAVFGLLGLVLFLKYGGEYLDLPLIAAIGGKIPNEIMSMFGPVTGAIMLKFQKMFVGDIVNKIEKL